jgi:hypothetical protein
LADEIGELLARRFSSHEQEHRYEQEEREGEEGSAAAIEWEVAIQPTIAGEDAAAALPKVKATPTAVPRIWVGNNSVL